MTLLYADRRFLDHDTGAHPESARRLEAVIDRLDGSPIAAVCQRPTWQPAVTSELAAVHDEEYLEQIAQFARRGGGLADPDTVVCPESFEIAQLAAGAVCNAVRRVVAGEDRSALCLVRPPGHHALPDRAMGFCLIGSIAVAARVATDLLHLERVLIVDWDVHHGNGTQAMFYDDPRVGFFSAHRWPFYPGTGARDDTGSGAGLGATRNVPVTFGTARRDYLVRFADELTNFAAAMRPQLVLLSAGFDSHAADPVGSLGLETEDFGELTEIVKSVAVDFADGRLVSLLEGGYNPPVLADCVELHLQQLATA